MAKSAQLVQLCAGVAWRRTCVSWRLPR
jgi:hypothetical protein